MNNDEWHKTQQGMWVYSHNEPGKWVTDMAVIQCTARQQWHLFINRNHVATFNTWDEARDATPMMISLHGHTKDES